MSVDSVDLENIFGICLATWMRTIDCPERLANRPCLGLSLGGRCNQLLFVSAGGTKGYFLTAFHRAAAPLYVPILTPKHAKQAATKPQALTARTFDRRVWINLAAVKRAVRALV